MCDEVLPPAGGVDAATSECIRAMGMTFPNRLWVAGIAVAGVVSVLAVGGRSHAQQQAAAAPASPQPFELAAADSGNLTGPRQPILFRHDIHAGQLKMQCQYCHYSVAVSPEPGIPSMQTCMGCHLVIGGKTEGNKAEIKKLRQAWNDKKPVEWVRIHRLAKHAHFPHMRHIKALGPSACATCHGDVTRMAQVFQVNPVRNMGWCITCHLQRGVSRDCSVCHY